MLKKYKVKVRSRHPETDRRKGYNVEFYVRSKPTRNGVCHEAIVIGPLPVLAGHQDPYDRSELMARKSYLNRTWEPWSGQSVLRMLWNKVLKLGWVDVSCLPEKNPFDAGKEPKHESLWDPDELFARN